MASTDWWTALRPPWTFTLQNYAAYALAWMPFRGREVLSTLRGQNWQLLTAAAFVSMALPVAVFFALQRALVRGILAAAVKG